ncbi:MAG: Lrp/AsnC family transcriptional regulator [Candidatus Geothermarchaeales archaeon]
MKIDDVDRQILNELQENARTPFRVIGEKLGISEATVFVRVKKLRKEGVIKGFRAIVSPKKVGKAITAFVLVKATPTQFPKVLEALKKIDNIYEIYDVTGVYYSILKVRAKDHAELAQTLDSIGTIRGISSTETSVVLRAIKEESKILV